MKKLATILAAIAFCATINAQNNVTKIQNNSEKAQTSTLRQCPESNKGLKTAQLKLTKNDRVDRNNKNFKRPGAPKLATNKPQPKKK